MTATMNNLNLDPAALTLREVPLQETKLDAKRMLDVIGALMGLVICLPVVVVCAIWISICSRGPVIFSQWRLGKNGVLFRIYKLRTMKIDAERNQGACFAAKSDPRVLPGCQWMRRCHADELPQILNVLLGDMSLVGPRPERPEMHVKLQQTLRRMDQRLNAKPGITGLAQVRNGYTDDLAGAKRKLAYDLIYLKHAGFWQDVKLILMTFPKLWDQTAH